MRNLFLFLLSFVNLSGCAECFLTPIVRTKYGQLRGLRSVSGQNRYYGIPYATSKRFQTPREPPRWAGVRLAVFRYSPCAQIISSTLPLGSEDCLSLDVYAPEAASHKLPVMVFFHGGAYYYGSKIDYDPEFLVTKNVVAVIPNYRLGVFGFLCLNGTSNLGLRDQVAALKWVKRNIAAFGGDPDNVSLVGESAGAASASLHMFSEHSKDLFHKLILMSGHSLTSWALNPEPMTAVFADTAKRNILPVENKIYEFFSTSTVNEIHAVSKDTSRNPRYFKYSPCVDSNLTDPFFLDTPYNLIKAGRFKKVPIMIGLANNEGLLFCGLHDGDTIEELDDDFVERLPSVFSWCSKRDRLKIAKKLRKHFFGSERLHMGMSKNIMDFYSAWIANATVDSFVELMGKNSDQPVYKYVFAYEGDRNYMKVVFGGRFKARGATHSDDLFYLFKPAGISLFLSNRDKLMIDRMTTMFTNFMKFGNPTPARTKLLPLPWPAATNGSALVLDTRLRLQRAEPTLHERFYLELLCTYGQAGYVPCDSAQQCSRG